jgi:biotin-(acetyl-CoA carboxylase) ligase
LSTIGEEVTLSFGKNSNENVLVGLAESISDDGGLRIRKRDGSLFTANAGEVTLAEGRKIL